MCSTRSRWGLDTTNSEYFTGDWRAEGNNYSLETRRQIEAKNPFLIAEVFQPKKVLDLGCGPGALSTCSGSWAVGAGPPIRPVAPRAAADKRSSVHLRTPLFPIVGIGPSLVLSKSWPVFRHYSKGNGPFRG